MAGCRRMEDGTNCILGVGGKSGDIRPPGGSRQMRYAFANTAQSALLAVPFTAGASGSSVGGKRSCQKQAIS